MLEGWGASSRRGPFWILPSLAKRKPGSPRRWWDGDGSSLTASWEQPDPGLWWASPWTSLASCLGSRVPAFGSRTRLCLAGCANTSQQTGEQVGLDRHCEQATHPGKQWTDTGLPGQAPEGVTSRTFLKQLGAAAIANLTPPNFFLFLICLRSISRNARLFVGHISHYTP